MLIVAGPTLADDIPKEARTVVFLGAGDWVDVLAARPELGGVVVDADPARAAALRTADAPAAWTRSGRLGWLTGPDFAGASQLARAFPGLHTAPVIVSPALAAAPPAAVASAEQALAQLRFQASANDDARQAAAGRYLLHTIANLPRIARESDAAALRGLAAGVPAIICAAGPSLDRNVHDLAPIRDRAVVIACDTAARPLISLGVEPDFIVASDPSRANAGHLSSLPPSRSWLVGEGSLHPSAFAHFDQRTFMFRVSNHEPWPWLASIDHDRLVLDTWGSVATSAFSLAELLGCSPIVLMGADFSFTDGRPYCRGTSFEPLWASWVAGGATYDAIWEKSIDRWPRTTAADIHGRDVRTAPHLVSFRDWMVERSSARPAGTTTNATGAGILTGAGITQALATPTLAAHSPLDFASVHARIRDAHVSRRGQMATLLPQIGALLRAPEHPTLETWRRFAGSVSVASIRSALQSSEFAAWSLAASSSTVPQELAS